jgi:hypothetical protein
MLILCHVRKKVELEVLPAAVRRRRRRRRRRGRVERRGRLTLPTAREGDGSWGRLLPMLLLRGMSERAAEREGRGFGAVVRDLLDIVLNVLHSHSLASATAHDLRLAR